MAEGVLFHNPIVGQLSGSGYKLFFYLTTTTTDVEVYSDDLVTAHTQPVVANSDGEFPAIYIDPSDGDLNVVLKDASDNTLYAVDPYPTNDLSTITSDVSTLQTDLTAVDGRLTTAESEIDTLQTESIDYESRISTNETDIAALESAALNAFVAVLAVPGQIKFPTDQSNNDLIVKFQTISVGADTTATITWDEAFPNAFLFALSGFNSNLVTDQDAATSVYDGTTTQATVQNTASATETIGVLAIGY